MDIYNLSLIRYVTSNSLHQDTPMVCKGLKNIKKLNQTMSSTQSEQWIQTKYLQNVEWWQGNWPTC